MGTISDMSDVYRAAMKNDWREMINYYDANSERLLFPITVTRDTSFHLAVRSKKEQPLKRLLDIYREEFYQANIIVKNIFGNTPLHECTVVGNVEALKLLVSSYAGHLEEDTSPSSSSYPAERGKVGYKSLLWEENEYGETPMFRAVSFGRTKMVKLLKEAEVKLLKEAEVKLLKEEVESLKDEVELLKEAKVKLLKEEVESLKDEVELLKEAKVKLLNEAEVKLKEAEQKLKESEAKASGDMTTEDGLRVLRRIPDHHRSRADSTPLLHVAIQGEHFETALMLLKWDESIGDMKTMDGITALRLLANKPSAFKSGCSMGPFNRILYHCLPMEDEDADPSKSMKGSDDLEWGQSRTANTRQSYLISCICEGILRMMINIYLTTCNYLIKGWPKIKDVSELKKKHTYAVKLAELLIKKDTSWDQVVSKVDPSAVHLFNDEAGGQSSNSTVVDDKPATDARKVSKVDPSAVHLETHLIKNKGEELEIKGEKNPFTGKTKIEEMYKTNNTSYTVTPLFVATKNGIIEIVKETIRQHPAAVEHINDKQQTILHIAIMHRSKEIYELLTGMKMALGTLRNVVDIDGYSLLHQVANVEHYIGGNRLSPALQLQEELQWFESVKKIVPPYYAMLREYKKNKTAEELFEMNHRRQLKRAINWVKSTAQSWSTVATFIATVVFAAAYTVPGGYDKGLPILKDSPFFLLFTITDVIALASSLTSVMTFLSLLTSPFELKEFNSSIPNKLIGGSTLLFFSVVTTMLSFGSTILLTIQTGKKWTTSFISIAAFLPVFVFVLMQFNLYVALMALVKDFLLLVWEGIPFVHLSLKHN